MSIIQKFSTSGKRIAVLFLLPFFFSIANSVIADEVALYDATGQYVGFYDPKLDSIYLSSGEAVAYIDRGTGAVYGYNGKFLGWYKDGTIRDTNGLIIGFAQANAPRTIQLKPVPSNVIFVRKPIPSPVQTQVIVEKPPVFRDDLSPTPFSTIFVYPSGAEPVK